MQLTHLMTPTQTRAAWAWLLNNLPPRQAIGRDFSYDDLVAWQDVIGRLLHPSPTVFDQINVLYSMSTFCDARELKDLVNGVAAPKVAVPTPLDKTLRDLYASETRFRHSLAEHLGFWVPLAIRKRAEPTAVVAGSKPHVLPEDTGPDGIVLDCTRMIADLVSIKSSLKSPRSMIASSAFRRSGVPAKKKPPQLDEFQLYDKRNHGFTKVANLALNLASAAQLNLSKQAENALFATLAYHAFVVGSHQHAAPTLFDGFGHIANTSTRRIATYVGAADWKVFAKRARVAFRAALTSVGVSVRR